MPPEMIQLATAALVMICVGGVVWVFLYPLMSGEKRAEARLDLISSQETRIRRGDARGPQAPTDLAARRKQIEESLKEIEARQKRISKNPNLNVRIEQAGLIWTKNTFFIVSVVCGIFGFFAGLMLSYQILIGFAFGFAFGFGVPRWYLNFAKKRRLNKFLLEFPNAVDVIVRGVKAGLPLADCMRVCARDSAEPVKTEFRKIIETTQLGVTIAEATEKLYERVPVTEANFFGIVISVQQKAGGNLSEVLGNLSKVLRDRKKMKQKIQAMSMEAKSSAAIIGALPGIVMILVYISTPDYIALLWTTSTGQFLMMISAAWMMCGVLVMRKMINFDF